MLYKKENYLFFFLKHSTSLCDRRQSEAKLMFRGTVNSSDKTYIKAGYYKLELY